MTTPAAAQAGDSLLVGSAESRVVVHPAEWATLPPYTMRVSFHDQPAQRYAGDQCPSRWARPIVALQVRTEPT